MPPLARRNLFHDKVRLIVTVTGIVFAVVLIVVELGLFVGFAETTSSLIDHSGADLWVTSRLVPYVEQGSVEELKRPDAVIMDEIYKAKLGVTHTGELFEINGRRARVVGFTRGIRSFTTSPYVFTTFNNSESFTNVPDDQTIFILVKVAPGASVEQVRRGILGNVKDVEVFTSHEFSRMTQFYWMFTTGAGVAVLLAAVLGLVVGFVVVAQTIYATTVDHLKEFGTLKAMGAPNSYVYKVIITQAAISAVMGYVLGMMVSGFVVRASSDSDAVADGDWNVFSDAADVRERGAGFD